MLIGIDMDDADLCLRLNAYLLTNDEMAAGLAACMRFADPFPAWDEFDPAHHAQA